MVHIIYYYYYDTYNDFNIFKMLDKLIETYYVISIKYF